MVNFKYLKEGHLCQKGKRGQQERSNIQMDWLLRNEDNMIKFFLFLKNNISNNIMPIYFYMKNIIPLLL